MRLKSVQTGCSYSSIPEQSIHLREKSIAGPTERPTMRSIVRLGGQDLRFSMKMMPATDSETSQQPVGVMEFNTLKQKMAKVVANSTHLRYH